MPRKLVLTITVEVPDSATEAGVTDQRDYLRGVGHDQADRIAGATRTRLNFGREPKVTFETVEVRS